MRPGGSSDAAGHVGCVRETSGDGGRSAAGPSSCLRYPSGKDKKNKIPQEQRPPQTGLRALTPRAMPVVCVNLCSKFTEVVGSYA